MFPENEKHKNCFFASYKNRHENLNWGEINQSFLVEDLLAMEILFKTFSLLDKKMLRLYAIHTILLERFKQLVTRVQDTITCYQVFQAHVS